MESRFEASDKSLTIARTILLAFTIIEILISVLCGIFFIANEATLKGIFFILLGTPIVLAKYFLFMALMWIGYDIKMVRNALYHVEESEYLFGMNLKDGYDDIDDSEENDK